MRSARRWIASLALGIAGGACATGEDPAETVKRANASLEESGAPFRWEHEDAGEGDAVIRRVLIGTPAPSAGKDGHQAYLIVFTPSASGGTEISLSGPWGVTR
jgi:hypothetical protein